MPRKVMERECRRKFALEPLWRLAQRQLSEEDTLTWEGLAQILGTTREKLRYVAKAGIGCYDADRWAIRLGHFPNSVWSDYYDDILGVAV